MKKEKTAAVVLAAGRGTRMHSDVPKQYMLLEGRPLICYALKVFQDSFIDEIVLVTEAGEEARCRQEIVEAFGFYQGHRCHCRGQGTIPFRGKRSEGGVCGLRLYFHS